MIKKIINRYFKGFNLWDYNEFLKLPRTDFPSGDMIIKLSQVVASYDKPMVSLMDYRGQQITTHFTTLEALIKELQIVNASFTNNGHYAAPVVRSGNIDAASWLTPVVMEDFDTVDSCIRKELATLALYLKDIEDNKTSLNRSLYRIALDLDTWFKLIHF